MKTKKKAKHQRAKLAALPILLGVLGYVLWAPADSQPEGSQDSPSTPPTALHTSPQTARPAPLAAPPEWPEVDLQFLSLANPLASREPSASPEHFTSTPLRPSPNTPLNTEVSDSAANQPELDSLQQLARDLSGSQVNYVFKSKRRKTIMLGDQLFDQGAQMSDTVQLHDIEDHGLVLMEIPSPQTFTEWIRQLSELAVRTGQLLRQSMPPQPVRSSIAEFD